MIASLTEEALRREMQELNKQGESILAGKNQGEEGLKQNGAHQILQ